MGVIKKTQAGSYQANAYDTRGKRIRKTFKKHSEAQAFINKLEAVKYDKKLVSSKLRKSRVLFTTALEDYLLTKSGLAKKSIVKYEHAVDQFKEFVDALNLIYIDQFTPDHADILYKILISGKKDSDGNIVKAKPKTINQFLQTIRAIFNLEVEKGHIDRSPLLHIKNLKVEKPRPEYYSEEELKSDSFELGQRDQSLV